MGRKRKAKDIEELEINNNNVDSEVLLVAKDINDLNTDTNVKLMTNMLENNIENEIPVDEQELINNGFDGLDIIEAKSILKQKNQGKSNLVNFRDMSKEELSLIREKGLAKAKETKKMQADMRRVLAMKPSGSAQILIDKLFGCGHHIDMSQAIALVQAQKAILGDTRAAEFVRDTSGNKPVDKVESLHINMSEEKFNDFFDRFEQMKAKEEENKKNE